MKQILSALAFVGLASCASSSIVPEGPDSYLIYRQGGTGFSGTGTLKIEAIREANEFCQKSGKQFRIVRTNETPGGALGRYPSAEVGFMCLSPGDADLVRPKMSSAPDKVIEIRQN